MHVGIDSLRALQNLIHVEVLLGRIHHAQNHAPLPRQPYALFLQEPSPAARSSPPN